MHSRKLLHSRDSKNQWDHVYLTCSWICAIDCFCSNSFGVMSVTGPPSDETVPCLEPYKIPLTMFDRLRSLGDHASGLVGNPEGVAQRGYTRAQ